VPFPVLVDLDGSAYLAFGLADDAFVGALKPQVWGPWLKANLSADTRQRGLQGGNFSQQSGAFVVDGNGVVRYVHRNRHAADDPDTGELLRAVAVR
jgi:hypothetical protein